ncbi:MAG: recombination protein RecR [Bacteriovoracaceae bacterium]|nr:recombination protein RecR [Bacteriovoracaceae bacterium]
MANPINELIEHLSRLPGIGERTATRLAFHLMRSNPVFREGLSSAIARLSEVHLCTVCSTVTDRDPCAICTSHVRKHEVICVVEKPSDIYSIERLHSYQGVYHVLHGLLSPLEGIAPGDLRIAQLQKRIQEEAPKEVILALSPTLEGDATSAFLVKQLSAYSFPISRLASGLAIGSNLEFADQITLGKAFEARTRVG